MLNNQSPAGWAEQSFAEREESPAYHHSFLRDIPVTGWHDLVSTKDLEIALWSLAPASRYNKMEDASGSNYAIFFSFVKLSNVIYQLMLF